MDWLLTLFLIAAPGAPRVPLEAGHMASMALCRAAGDLLARAYVQAHPAGAAGWKCQHRGVAS